mgnify:CR=1 FL=1
MVARPPPPTPLGEPLLTAAEVAAYLRVDRGTVHRLAGASDGLPAVDLAPRVRRFRAADVRAFVERRTRAVGVSRTRSERLLGGAQRPAGNGLATSRRQSVHARQESSADSDPPHLEAQG